jgi:hypothetical protein
METGVAPAHGGRCFVMRCTSSSDTDAGPRQVHVGHSKTSITPRGLIAFERSHNGNAHLAALGPRALACTTTSAATRAGNLFGGNPEHSHTERVQIRKRTPALPIPSAKLVWALAVPFFLGACGLESHEVERLDPICSMETPGALFEKRIAPILAEDRPKSCNQCHLAGVDLGAFVRETPCETMACLSEQGLIDLSSPKDSQILAWIDRAQPDSELITKDVIQQEHEGFLEWISYGQKCFAANCADVKCGARSGEVFCEVEPEPYTVLDAGMDQGCDDLALETLFRDAVYASRKRCFPCHFVSEMKADKNAPRWIKQEGNCDESSLATMRAIIAAGYVNVEDPAQSLLLLKPLAEAEGGLMHGGGDKFHDAGDSAYLNFKLWIDRYAACQR